MNKALGIDIGGTKISYALINNKGKILNDVEKISTPKTVDEIVSCLKNIISKFENEIEFIAIATAGAVNNENTGVIGSTANLANGKGILIKLVFVPITSEIVLNISNNDISSFPETMYSLFLRLSKLDKTNQ